MRRAGLERNDEAAALADLAFHLYAACMQLNQLPHQREPDTCSLVRARRSAFDPVEAIEQSRDLIGCDPHAAILDGQLRGAVEPNETHGDAALKGMFERVGEEIE